MWQWLRGILSSQRVLAGFVLGALAGWLMGPAAAAWFGFVGHVYVTLLALVLVPLVFFAAINATGALHAQQSAMLHGGCTLAWFAITAVLAVGAGLALGTFAQPGLWSGVVIDVVHVPAGMPALSEILLGMVPASVPALFDGSVWAGGGSLSGPVLTVLLVAVLIGAAMTRLGEQVAGTRRLAGEALDIVVQVLRFVRAFTPLAVFALIAALVGTYGLEKLLPLGKFVLVLYLACALLLVLGYSVVLLLHGLSPLQFFRGAWPGLRMAFTSSSSAASTPLAIHSIVHNLGVEPGYAASAVPLGASAKMDGCGAIFPVLCAVFIAQYLGVPLTADQFVVIALAAILGTLFTAGVPGTSFVMAMVVLGAAGLPLEAVVYLYVLDRFVDPMRTMTNVAGQMLVPVLVARQTGMLDRRVYANAAANARLPTVADASGEGP